MLACLFILLSLPLVYAGGWDDFSNNLATDLAPFLSLFGEQITKQCLSESITRIDYFIFAMAPMGILTAVVSAIRVCGSPSLRAFIGRAQEGGGNAGAELCSSTSRDVCELYNNGGIARVFGHPKILEVIHDPDHRDFTDETAGRYTFQEYLERKGNDNWYRCNGKGKEPSKGERNEDAEFAHDAEPPHVAYAPNLSLNIGIKKPHLTVFWAVALGGLILQAGVLIFAGIVTYYACPLVMIGTPLVCGGMFLCASLVGQSTDEEVWRRSRSNRSSIHWVQPGGQVIGDQTFDAFCYSDCDNPEDRLEEYTTSWKKNRSKNSELVTWAAISISVSGFAIERGHKAIFKLLQSPL